MSLAMLHVLVRAKVHWHMGCVTCSSVSSVLRACSIWFETITSRVMGVICLFPLSKELLPVHLCYFLEARWVPSSWICQWFKRIVKREKLIVTFHKSSSVSDKLVQHHLETLPFKESPINRSF